MFENYYADDKLRTPEAKPVPAVVHIYDEMQGDSLGTYVGTIVQFYTGSNNHFVCILSFEDWGSERCPRFTWYQRTETNFNRYEQCTHPTPNYSYDDIR